LSRKDLKGGGGSPSDPEAERRQRAEEALKENERRLGWLVDVSEDAICTHDPDGRILSANPAMVRLTGYSERELIGRLLADFLSESTRHEFRDYLEVLIRDGHAEGFMRIITKDGKERVLQYENVLQSDGRGGMRAFGVAHDVQRKWAENALRLSVSRLEALLNNIPDITWMKDDQGRFTAVNEAFARFLDRRREDIIGKTAFELFPEEAAGTSQAEDRIVLTTGKSLQISNEFVRPDGRRTLFETIKTPIRGGGSGRPSGTVGIARDISERRRLEEQLVQSQKMEAVGRLAGGIAHDFNNLLTSILGYCDLVLGQLDKSSALRPDIEEIEKAGERAAALTRQLLAFSRKQMIEPRVIALNDVVLDASKMLGRLIGENIDLVTALDSDLGHVQADPGQIEQVLVNLAVNAKDAMPQGGRLLIETKNIDSYEPYSSAYRQTNPGRYILLAVSDNGSGMDAETQRHIFEPFYTTKERGKGTGLGLATVYGIVKQNIGDIWVHSEPGKGSRFEVYLPRVDDPVQVAEPSPVPQALPKGSETLLLVEDEGAVRALAARVLKANGYTVLTAADADQAEHVSATYASAIDLLITDVIMPRTSGPQLARRLLIVRPQMRVLYISGYTDAAVAEHGGLDAEAALFQKPFTPASLAKKVREILDERRTAPGG
jgi:two-component system cell cycle sensor histidine kinase/response regulator CckA